MVITNQNASVEMAEHYLDIIIAAARTVDKQVIDLEENMTWESLTILEAPLVRYMGKSTEGQQKM